MPKVVDKFKNSDAISQLTVLIFTVNEKESQVDYHTSRCIFLFVIFSWSRLSPYVLCFGCKFKLKSLFCIILCYFSLVFHWTLICNSSGRAVERWTCISEARGQVLSWPPAGFVLVSPEFKSSQMLVNNQLVNAFLRKIKCIYEFTTVFTLMYFLMTCIFDSVKLP